VFIIIVASCITSAFCCNPFGESGHKNNRNLLPCIYGDYEVCDKCCKRISKLKCDVSDKQKDVAFEVLTVLVMKSFYHLIYNVM
jgi:hypothetical protein